MLALILSAAVGLASLLFFFSAFFAPKLHRKDDFLWSGFGFFYAAVLWICDRRFTGSILLGQTVAVILILSFAWQTLRLRAAIAKQGIEPAADFSVLTWIGGSFKGKRKAPVTPSASSKPTTDTPSVPPPTETLSESGDKEDQNMSAVSTPADSSTATTKANEPDEADIEADINVSHPPTAQPALTESTKSSEPSPAQVSSSSAPIQPKSSFFKRLFGKKQSPAPVPTTPPQSAEAIADREVTTTADTRETSPDESGIEPKTMNLEDSVTDVAASDSTAETESNWPMEPETDADDAQNIAEVAAIPTEEASSEMTSPIETEIGIEEIEEVAVLTMEVEDDETVETVDISTDETEISDMPEEEEAQPAIDAPIGADDTSVQDTEISVEVMPDAEEATDAGGLDDEANFNAPDPENKEKTE